MIISLPYAGTYDCYVSFPTNYAPGSTADCGIQYCISTDSTTPDSVVTNIIVAYIIGAGQQKSLITPTFRHNVCFISNNNVPYSMA